ncbi:MAG: hypothetical protein HZB42_13410 [Sphingobacteriales bacterium]|nr:hypothetical protein [Sphingobacteriales bacterium]
MLQYLYSRFYNKIFLPAAFCCFSLYSIAQENEKFISPAKDSTPAVIKKQTANKYDSAFKAHSPKKAALRSALLPGWGQIYNKKYWKLPIVYGALGTCTGIFFYNLGNYKDTRFAYRVKYNMRVNHTDSALYNDIKSNLKPIDEESLKFYRNQFRKDIDYTVLVFVLLWGLNVVDAAVDAHLMSFDVSPDLSFRIKPGHSEMAGTNGLSLVLSIR